MAQRRNGGIASSERGGADMSVIRGVYEVVVRVTELARSIIERKLL